jgi:hypothetical protein
VVSGESAVVSEKMKDVCANAFVFLLHPVLVPKLRDEQQIAFCDCSTRTDLGHTVLCVYQHTAAAVY